jgi:tetratricopeptide (TPR) repeat protein
VSEQVVTSERDTSEIRIFGAPPSSKQKLVGRDDLLTAVKNALLDGEDVALWSGLPGAGKTAVAASLARDHDLHGHFDDGVFWASLGRDEAGLRDKLMDWGEGLGLTRDVMEELPDARLRQKVSDAVGERRALMIIDDVWDLEHATLFRVGGSSTARLLTTRFEPIADSFAMRCLKVEELADAAGVALLEGLAPQVVSEFPEDAHRIVRSVGGLPLALVLIGAYLRRKGKTPSQRKRSLEEVLSANWVLEFPIRESGLEFEETKESIDAAIRFSEEALVKRELQLAFRTLTVFPPKVNDFAAAAAGRVADSADAVIELSEHGLVDLSDPDSERYTMHQAIWDYACRGDIDPNAYRRMADYFVDYIERQETSATDDSWLAGLERERDNIRAALDFAVSSGDAATALRLAGSLFKFWYERSHFAEGRARAKQILALEGSRAPALERQRAKLLNDYGNYLYNQGELDKADDSYREALQVRERLGLEQEQAGSYNNVALIARERGDLGEAQRLLERALEINRRLGRRDWEGKNLNNLGILALRRGDAKLAAERQDESRAVFAELNDRWGQAMALCDLGLARLRLNDLNGAEKACLESLELRKGTGDVRGIATSLRAVGEVAAKRGDGDVARARYSEALERSAEIQDESGAAEGLAGLAIHVEQQGDPGHAAALLGAVRAWRKRYEIEVPEPEQEAEERLRATLGDPQFEEAWVSRQRGSLRELIPLAIAHLLPAGGARVGQ